MLTVTAIIIKALFYASALMMIGLALHKSMRICQSQNTLRILAAVFITCAILRLVQLNAAAGGGWSYALSPDTFRWIWMANANQNYAFAVGTFLLLAEAVIRSPAISRAALILGAITVAAGFGLAGHTPGLEDPGFMPILAMGHVLVAGFWLAAPLTLFPRPQLDTPALILKTGIFSNIALWLVPTLFLSGLWLLWNISGSLSAVVTQNYGRLLLLKLLFATGLLGLGAYNKVRVSDCLKTNPVRGRKLLSRTLKAEALLFGSVIILISLVTTVFGPGHG